MIDDIDLTKLEEKEINTLKLNKLFSSSSKNQQTSLMQIILEYNSQKDNVFYSFFDFYCKKIPMECTDTEKKDKLQKSIRVRKSRLNTYIKEYNLYVDKNYFIYSINITSLSFLKKEILDMFKNKHISSIRIFDSYQEENKNLIFDSLFKKILEKMLFNDKEIQIISIFNNEETKEFYKDLLIKYAQNNNDAYLDIKFIRKPFVQSSSMLYALITDTNDNEYIFYYEKVTQWAVVTKVSKNETFSQKFHQLLDNRFRHYAHDKELRDTNDIIPVTLDLLNEDFFKSTENLILDLEELLFSEETNKKVISEKINEAIYNLKKIQIAFPNTFYVNSILYYHIKLVEISLLLKNTSLPNTRGVLKQLIESDLTKSIYINLKNEILDNQFILKDNELNNLDINDFRKKIYFEHYFDNFSLTDIFHELQWNTMEQIINSLNKILIDNKLASKLINKIAIDTDYEYNYQLIIRAIYENYFDIKFNRQLNLEKNEVNSFDKIFFKDEKIKHIIQRYIL